MEDRKAGSGDEEAAGRRAHPSRIRLKPAGEAVVTYKKSLVKSPGDKRIHSRRPLPPVPEAPSEERGQSQ
jgi:hypothetical protein